eukprot:6189561-Pleurochrysis_carterae.AAC.2
MPIPQYCQIRTERVARGRGAAVTTGRSVGRQQGVTRTRTPRRPCVAALGESRLKLQTRQKTMIP